VLCSFCFQKTKRTLPRKDNAYETYDQTAFRCGIVRTHAVFYARGYGTSDGYWKRDGNTGCIWQNTSAALTLYAHWIPNTYTVSIPKSVSYTSMRIGTVSTSDSYDIIVKHVTGSFGGTVTVSAKNGILKGVRGSSDVLTANVSSASSPIVFTSDGTKTDTLKLSGQTRTADKWTGAIQYSVSVQP
jgi:hypothetical protein